MNERHCDVLVCGGGLGGVAAALAALRLGRSVVITEETDWLGGQLTTQGVPPDENRWIEVIGGTRTYRELRGRIRDYYRRCYPLKGDVARDPYFNPGRGWVSRLCHEPRVALAAIEEMLAPYRSSGALQVLLEHRATAAECDGDVIRALTFADLRDGETTVIVAPYVLDATDLGDVLPLANVEHVIGAESQADTNEPHALDGPADPLMQQSFAWCFALDYEPGADHTIDRPQTYDFWRDYQAPFWPGKQLSWTSSDPFTLEPLTRELFDSAPGARDMWSYRRILSRDVHEDGRFASDITVVNWPQMDYWLGPLLGVSAHEAASHLHASRELSLSLLYWMQTEAGYPGLRLRGDVLGTTDGLAKAPYIREGRRIRAEFTVLEQHLSVAARGASERRAEQFPDTVGTGSYPIDLHPSTNGQNYVIVWAWPFQIPLGALIPERVDNLLAAGKNLGVTRITNGAYRLHPVEWNTGEAAGALAAHCLEKGYQPRQVRNDPTLLADFQTLLSRDLHVDLEWPEFGPL